MELTDVRAKPAVYFGGKTRIIDFALSNALNSGIRRIGVATQYKAHSLIRHMQRGWNFFRPERNESFDILPAASACRRRLWYTGTADAVYQNIDIIDRLRSAPHRRAGRRPYLQDGLRADAAAARRCSGADVTVGCLEVPREEASGFGVMHIDEKDRILSFLEKPKDPPAMPGKPDVALASMGIYVFETRFLFELLQRDAADPHATTISARTSSPRWSRAARRWRTTSRSPACAPRRNRRPIGATWARWMRISKRISTSPPWCRTLDLYDRDWPIWTYSEIDPPAKFVHDEDGAARPGGVVAGLRRLHRLGRDLRRTLLFTGVHVHSHAKIEEAVILPGVDIGRHARISRAVVDRGVQIPPGLIVGEDPVLDAQRFRRTERGVCLITAKMLQRLES